MFILKEILYFYHEVAIYLIFGFFVAGILHILFSESWITKHLGKGNLSSVFKATIGGIPLPLCSCGVIPVAASLRKKGASRGAALSFLISTPQVGADSFVITYSLIGWIFGVFRIIASFLTAIIAGIAVNLFVKEESKPIKTKQSIKCKSKVPQSTIKTRISSFFYYLEFELLGSIAFHLIIGLIIAGLISALIPESFFIQYMDNQFLSMLLMLIAGIPMYVCATSSTPIAASLLMKGISPGAALVFLLAGPATNSITISTVIKTMGKKTAIIYVSSIAIVSLALGYLLNVLALDLNIKVMQEHVHEILPEWLKLLGSITLGIMLLIYYIKKIFLQIVAKNTMENTNDKFIIVEGMTCMHCSGKVQSVVEEFKGVSDVNIDLNSKKVSFNYNSENLDKIKSAIELEGYSAK